MGKIEYNLKLFDNIVAYLCEFISEIGHRSCRNMIDYVEVIKGDVIFERRECSEYPDEHWYSTGNYLLQSDSDIKWSWMNYMEKVDNERELEASISIGVYENIDEIIRKVILSYGRPKYGKNRNRNMQEEIEKDHPEYNNLYEKNRNMLACAAQAGWKYVISQDLKMFKRIQNHSKLKRNKTKKSITIMNRLELIENLLELTTNSIDIFKAYLIYNVWELINIINGVCYLSKNNKKVKLSGCIDHTDTNINCARKNKINLYYL